MEPVTPIAELMAARTRHRRHIGTLEMEMRADRARFSAEIGKLASQLNQNRKTMDIILGRSFLADLVERIERLEDRPEYVGVVFEPGRPGKMTRWLARWAPQWLVRWTA